MVSSPLAGLAVGGLALAALALAVYRDARSVGVDPPARWAGLVLLTGGAALATYALVPDVPVPGLLVLVLLGPSVYLFEREDATTADVADPTLLPGRSPDDADGGRGRSDGTGAGGVDPDLDSDSGADPDADRD